MKFLDFFSGIGGFRLGLERAGMTCVGAAEIADFQRAAYAYRFGHPPTFGDMTKILPEQVPAADLWCGGWPCTDISSAGKRAGVFAGTRSNLIWPLLDLADDCEALGTGPTWLLLENVPGLLSGRDWQCGEETHAGRAEDPCPTCRRSLGDAAAGHVPVPWFGAVLGALADRGWVGAWRVLDAQWFGVAQRRERVFFLARRAGTAGPRPSEVLLEPPGVRRDPPPRRATGQEVAGTVTSGSSAGSFTPDAAAGGRLVVREHAADVNPTIVASGRGRVCDGKTEDEGGGLVAYAVPCTQEPFSIYPEHGQGADLVASPVDVSPSITATDGGKQTERGVRVAVIPFDRAQVTHPENRSRCEEGAPSPTIAASGQVHVAYSVFSEGSTATQDHARETDVARTLDRNGGFAAGQGGTVIVGAGPDTAHPVTTKSRNTPDGPDTYVVLPLDVRNSTRDAGGGAGSAGLGVGQPGDPVFTVTRSVQGVFACGVRRLMPVECERLFGLPDGWTDVPWNGKPAHDGKRYEALGNSVAVVVIEWIGRRLMRALGGHNANSVR